MGTMITLGVGKLEISWGKNNIFDNFFINTDAGFRYLR